MRFQTCKRIILGISLAANVVLLIYPDWGEALRPTSFRYRLYVENQTSEAFIEAALIQLTDNMRRKPTVPHDIQLISRGERRELTIGGECDAPTTLFLLVAYSCDDVGAPTQIPLRTTFLKFIPFHYFRLNTFDGRGKSGGGVAITVRDQDMVPVNLVPGTDSPLKHHDDGK